MPMSFDERFTLCMSNIENESKPDYRRYEVSYYADFIELLVLTSGGDGVSYGDVQDRFYGEEGEENDPEIIENEDTNPEEMTVSRTNDLREAFIDSIFNVIRERVQLFGDLYPFELSSSNVITVKGDISVDHKKYVFLLLSSTLNLFLPFNAGLTTDFEKLSYDVLKEFLPSAEVKAFGKNSEYTGTAKEKIRKLAEDIGIEVNEKNLEEVDDRNVQDRGLDVAGWIPFKDQCPNFMLFLGQCACGKKYAGKQIEIMRFANYLYFPQTKPQLTLFVPYALINLQKDNFYHSADISDCLLFERKRMLDCVKGKDEAYNNLEMKPLVERLLAYSPYGEVCAE